MSTREDRRPRPVQRLVVLPSAMEPAAAHDAMELGATSSAIDANSNSLVAPVIQSRPSAMELLAAMELPSAMEPSAVRNTNFGVGSASIHAGITFFDQNQSDHY